LEGLHREFGVPGDWFQLQTPRAETVDGVISDGKQLLVHTSERGRQTQRGQRRGQKF
jgi:hypothetical protein